MSEEFGTYVGEVCKRRHEGPVHFMQIVEHVSSQKGHVMTHYAPDRQGVDRLGCAYLLRCTKMSQNCHVLSGLPVVFYC
jgi:hypothetical protein